MTRALILTAVLLLVGCGEAVPPKPCELREVTYYWWHSARGWVPETQTLCIVSEKRLATPFKGEPK